MSNKNYNEDTARKPNVILVASYVHSIVHAPSTHAHQSRRQHNSSSTTTAFPPYKLGVLLRASSTSSRPVLRSPKFRSVQYDAQNINRHTVFLHARTTQELDRHTVLSANKSNVEFLACTTHNTLGPPATQQKVHRLVIL